MDLKISEEEEKNNMGRPPKPYCLNEEDEKNISYLFSEGKTIYQVIQYIREQKKTFSYYLMKKWCEESPIFKFIIKDGIEASQAWWEEQGRSNLLIDKMESFQNSTYIFNMKNRFKKDYGDVSRVDVTSMGEKLENKPERLEIVVFNSIEDVEADNEARENEDE